MKNRIGANEHIEHGQELYKKYREKGKNGEHTTDVLHTKYLKRYTEFVGFVYVCVSIIGLCFVSVSLSIYSLIHG